MQYSWIKYGAILSCVVVMVVAQEQNARTQQNTLESIRNIIDQMVQPHVKKILRFVLEADVSADCQVYLAKFGAAVRRFEPWATRLIDASGKFPSGLQQGTLIDIGAYDECLETVLHHEETGEETLRGQYCNIYIKTYSEYIRGLLNITALSHPRTPKFISFQNSNDVPGILIGVCVSTDCSREDLQKLGDRLAPVIFGKVNVANCVDGLPRSLDNRQIFALCILCVVVMLVFLGTAFDFYPSCVCSILLPTKSEGKQSERTSLMKRIVLCFSAKANTSLLLEVNNNPNSDAYAYRFFHGIRFISIYGVVVGHSFSVFNLNSTSRLVNALHYGESYWFCFIMSAYLCVDTFLFLAGFLLTFNILREPMDNPVLVAVIPLIRRFIRGTLPALFVMVILFLIPVVFDGPRVMEWYEDYKSQFDNDWLAVLLQIRNYNSGQYANGAPCMGPLWYLSVDFQLFFVVVITLVLTKRKAKTVHWMMTCYSVTCALFIAIYIYDTVYTPFVVPMAEQWETIKLTIFYFYIYTPVHAVMFFMGTSTVYIIRDYKEKKISFWMSFCCWAVTSTCVLIAVFGTHPWNSGNYPGEAIKVLFAVFQRPFWGIFLMWLTFCCATGRATTITRFLSLPVFVPLSRLSFGVFLLHVPIIFLEFITARERLFYRVFVMLNRSFSTTIWSLIVAYLLFLLVEAPLGRIEKLVLQACRAKVSAGNNKVADIETPMRHRSLFMTETVSQTMVPNIYKNNLRSFKAVP
ncbi:nose resistant to fluoxetine protein 6-like isoform X2 [Varroa jacobsoni]|uniref:nose resistant to fluoxetine protein 6-like isoform X2 n=1 Tax=Varroa jacobsoni TaxID=62625 RepID=UPI000BFA2DF1|nr:nose resistant to fluoxetine protein 6-like isoform X2 [Varroa jacobsoni]